MLKKTPVHAKVAAHVGIGEDDVKSKHVLQAHKEGAISDEECIEALSSLIDDDDDNVDD